MTSFTGAGTTLVDSSTQLGPLLGGAFFLALVMGATAAATATFRRQDA
ncbi:hypothetical protein [Streptomyces sp. WAC06614]|nr:hypothetical protein [Streptomyces sp. WAC06614]